MLPKDGQPFSGPPRERGFPGGRAKFKLLGGVYLTIYNNLDGGTMACANAIAEMDVVRERALELLAYTDELRGGNRPFRKLP